MVCLTNDDFIVADLVKEIENIDIVGLGHVKFYIISECFKLNVLYHV